MVERLINRLKPNRLKIDNSLTPASFDSLLAFLGPDRESAALAYLEIRRALFTFFAVRGAASPDEMTDETINRVARRLSEGARIEADNPSSYFYAVGRNVWRESLTGKNVLIPLSDSDPAPGAQATPNDLMINAREQVESEARSECLERCLDQLDPEERELIVSYYRFSGGEKIENRFAAPQGVDEIWAVFGDIAEEYLDGDLSESESRRFEQRLRSAPALREMFEIESAMFDYAARAAAEPARRAEADDSISGLSRRRQWPRITFLNPAQLAAAAAGVIALVALVTWFALRTREVPKPVSPEGAQPAAAPAAESPDRVARLPR